MREDDLERILQEHLATPTGTLGNFPLDINEELITSEMKMADFKKKRQVFDLILQSLLQGEKNDTSPALLKETMLFMTGESEETSKTISSVFVEKEEGRRTMPEKKI